MASTKKVASKPAKKAANKVAVKKVASKKVASKKVATRRKVAPVLGWATPIGTLTLKDLVQVGLVDSETDKIDPPHGLRVILADKDIEKIVSSLAAALKRD